METENQLPDTAKIEIVDASMKRGNFKTLILSNVTVKTDFSDPNFEELIKASYPKEEKEYINAFNNFIAYGISMGWIIKDDLNPEYFLDSIALGDDNKIYSHYEIEKEKKGDWDK